MSSAQVHPGGSDIDLSRLPVEVRERLAQLELELSEGKLVCLYLYEFVYSACWLLHYRRGCV
jgi:hypothetical protein